MTGNKQARHDAKQLYRLCLVNSVLDEERVRQVVQQTIAADGRNSHAILHNFLRLVRLDCAKHTATVESATPLPEDLKSEIQTDLTHRYGSGLTTTFAERPSLIGGMRIQVGGDVYDGSVQAGLAALEKSF